MKLRASVFVHICRSLLRYWGLTLLNAIGLAIGAAAAIIIALYIRNELSFDRFLPDADRVMIVTSVYSPPNSPVVSKDKVPAGVAEWLRQDIPAVDAVTRLYASDWPIRSERFQSVEHFFWADANLFDLLRFRAVAGDLKTALAKPYSIVVTQKVARRYFGRDDVVGQTLFINGGSPLTVTAVLADFPANNSLGGEIFISGSTGYGMLTVLDVHPTWQWASCYTFLRLKPGAQVSPQAIRDVVARHWKNTYNLPTAFRLVSLPALHFEPEVDSPMSPRGHRDTVTAMAVVAGLILFLAAVNFAGLMTAQIDERREEMMIRRSLGAQRRHLFLQVFGETAVINMLAVVCALALVERFLPLINRLLRLELSVWTAPGFSVACAFVAILTGIAAGLYPAIVLSSVPASSSREAGSSDARGYLGRVGWIAVQFSLLITLLIASATIYRQWTFATGAALNFDTGGVVQIEVYKDGGLEDTFRQHVIALSGVANAAYSRDIPVESDTRPGWAVSPSGGRIQFTRETVDPHFFAMFGVRLLAGRNFAANKTGQTPDDIILTQSAAKALGYRSPADAVGRTLDYIGDNTHLRSRIIGVVADMRIDTVREPLHPMVFDYHPDYFDRLNVKLRPGREEATLSAIDAVWKRDYPTDNPMVRHFYSEYLDGLYRDMIQQWWAFGLLSIVGICLSILGLTGLSVYLARARLREIAIRSALGARLWDIFMLRIEPFVRPLIIANGVAGLAAWALMSWWLSSFSAHVDLDPLSFAGAGAVTVVIAFITLTLHAFAAQPARSSQPLRTD